MKRLMTFASLVLVSASCASAQAAAEFGFKPGSVTVSESSGQAGAHLDLTTEFELNSEEGGEPVDTTGLVKIALPAGMTGNPNAVQSCTMLQLLTTDIESPASANGCPVDAQVGVAEVFLFNSGGIQFLTEPIYNMEPPSGGNVVARLGFYGKVFPTVINLRVRSDTDYGLTAYVEDPSSYIPLLSAKTTIWGVPADESHDPLRITPYEAVHCNGEPCTSPGEQPRHSGLVPAPFLTNPTHCAEPQNFEFTAVSYADVNTSDTESVQLPPPTGCGSLGFAPSFTALPTSREAAAPTGLDVDLSIPQDETAKGRATSELRDARVVLPRGMTIAAGAADGLLSCSADEVGYRSTEPAQCPEASKIGMAEIDVPALSHKIQGAVYQRTPEPDHLFRIWLSADELGIHLAVPGEIELDPTSGQITSLFLDAPEAPVRDFKLHFKAGSRAPLANPPSCGTYQTSYEFSPWSGTAPVVGDTPMTIDQGCGTGGFDPKLSAGSVSPAAGSFSPFVTEVTRQTGEQNISGLSLDLPKGVLAKLAGVQLCDGDALRTGDCPTSSRIGTIEVASGPGSSPLWIPQRGKEPTAVYLAGPYEGAPFSLVVKVPAQAGPFDLGTVVTRAGIQVDPESVRASVVSDPLPQILQGVPVTYRVIHVDVNRPDFTLNPTNCHEKNVIARLSSPQGANASPSSRFQAAGCRELPFRPKLSLKLKGGTTRGAHPALTAVLTARAGDANIGKAQVALPHSEFLDQAHIGTVCTRVQFAARECPPRSVYGHAEAWTPLLDAPLQGSVYLRSSNHVLPDLVADLNGQIHVVLDGRIDSVNGGIRSTFEAVPDAPVRKFVLSMQGGKKGLLENSTNLCGATHRATANFTGQNGKPQDFKPTVKVRCGKSAKGKRHRR